ncbi:XRE family transcriptional regulator [Campylobacter pinnipediorum]|uniref:XRE family transcriptional regulator n=1 Tax=Campylobacter pinnipediorum TaxID=1965231 RepID=UPI00099526CF|nr:LexA family transcriptional regulator [Campylobacter pinnipediorum]AQW83015.1 peptidase S24 LexA-like protein [Campylobacter pinnipediorum subsp. pinnipediorum]
MDLADIIRKARKRANLTQLQFADKLGVTQAMIAQYETKKGEIGKNGKEKKTALPGIDKLQEIADILGEDITLFFPNREKNKKHIIEKELKSNFEKYIELIPSEFQIKNTVFLPKSEMLIGAGAEGAFDLSLFESETRVAVDKKFIGGLNPANLKLFEVVGDSMFPEYDEGDLAIVDMVNHRYDFVKIAGIYVVRVGDVVYIKRVEFLPENAVKLISLNSKYGDMYPHKDGYECEILGKVCGKIKFEISKGLTFSDSGIK